MFKDPHCYRCYWRAQLQVFLKCMLLIGSNFVFCLAIAPVHILLHGKFQKKVVVVSRVPFSFNKMITHSVHEDNICCTYNGINLMVNCRLERQRMRNTLDFRNAMATVIALLSLFLSSGLGCITELTRKQRLLTPFSTNFPIFIQRHPKLKTRCTFFSHQWK